MCFVVAHQSQLSPRASSPACKATGLVAHTGAHWSAHWSINADAHGYTLTVYVTEVQGSPDKPALQMAGCASALGSWPGSVQLARLFTVLSGCLAPGLPLLHLLEVLLTCTGRQALSNSPTWYAHGGPASSGGELDVSELVRSRCHLTPSVLDLPACSTGLPSCCEQQAAAEGSCCGATAAAEHEAVGTPSKSE